MSEELIQSCSNCEWLVRVGGDKACNAFQVVTDNVADANLCGEWEQADDAALLKRNELTAEKVIRPIPIPSLPIDFFDYVRQVPEGFLLRPHYMPMHVTEELQERQSRLNKIHQVIRKIEIQKDYIRNRFNFEPIQVLFDVKTLREIAQHREVEHNISYAMGGKKWWRDLEIIECRSPNDQPIVEVLFLNLLM